MDKLENKTENYSDLKNHLMKIWLCRVATVSYAHYEASKYHKSNDRFDVKLIISLTIVALTISNIQGFGLEVKNGIYLFLLNIVPIAISVLAVIFSMFHYSKRSRDNAHRHSLSASAYSELKREIEILLTQNEISLEDLLKVKYKMDVLATWCPTLENYTENIVEGYRGSLGDVYDTEAEFLSKLGIKPRKNK